MKLYHFSAGGLMALTYYSAFLTTKVAGDGYTLNADTCSGADRKGSVALSDFHLETEGMYGPLIDYQVAGAPADCLPNYASGSYYGAWYELIVPGTVGEDIQLKAYTWAADQENHAVAVMEGGCTALTCLANIPSMLELGQQHVDQVFTIKANVPYHILWTVEQVPNVQATVPHIEIVPASHEAECNLQRSYDILNLGYGTGGPGICTPCVQAYDTVTQADGSLASVETWTTTCSDACQRCFDVTNNPLYTGTGPFCYNASRTWTKTILSNTETEDTRHCYTFGDNTQVCDHGPKDGACPLYVNGVACSSCVEDHNQTGCPFPLEQYGVFRADCSNIAGGSATIDKCTSTGFSGPPAITNYGIYTDIINANNTPGAIKYTETQGQCSYGSERALDPNEVTFAPTPTPNEPVTLDLGTRTSKAPVAQGQTLQYVIDVTGRAGVIACDTRAGSGDVDLFVAIDKSPLDLSALDCVSEQYDSNERCDVAVEGSSQVNVNVYGYTDAVDMELKCVLKGLSDAHTMKVGVDKKSDTFDLQANAMKFYKLDSPENSARVICTTDTNDGDLDLWMRIGDVPIPFVEGLYDCQSIAQGGDENCEIQGDQLLSGPDIYILMWAYDNVTKGQLACQEILSNATTLSRNNAEKLDRGKTKNRFDLLENEKRAFYIDVDSRTTKAWCDSIRHSDIGQVQLYTRVGDLPVLPGDGDAPDDQCSDGFNGHCEYSWDGGTGSTQFFAITVGQDNQQVVGVDINCNTIVPFRQQDATEVKGKKTFGDLVEEQEVGVYWNIQQHTGEIKCTTGSKSGDMHIYGGRSWPSVNGGNDCDGTTECRYTYGNAGSASEKFYFLIRADNNVHNAEVRCSAKPSDEWKRELEDRGGTALQDFLDDFNTGV